MMHRAYSLLEVKAVKDDERIITGIATTPAPDRVGDIVEPLGVKFKNPLPLLHHHRADQPVGTVRFDKPTKDGITFTAKLPKIDEAGPLKDRVDTAWGEVKSGLIRGVSIGFRDLEYSRIENGGLRFIETEVLELSLVAIPANAEATIQTVKSADAELLAATGTKQNGDLAAINANLGEIKAGKVFTPPAPGKKSKPIVKAQEGRHMKKPIAETISAFKATRQLKADRMAELMDAATEKGVTLDEAEQQEYDGLKDEIKSIDAHVERLDEMQKLQVEKAVVPKGDTADDASKTRGGVRVESVRANVPKGISFARLAIALGAAKGNYMQAYEMAKGATAWDNTPEVVTVLKAAVAAGSMSNLAALVEPRFMASELIEYLWPQTIIGRIPGFRRVPFNIKVPRETSVASVNWVGEAKPKPVSKGALDTVTLGQHKLAGIVPLTEEVLKFSDPAAETLVRDQLSGGIIKMMDKDFLDPEKAAVAGVSPASVTYGVTGVSATGTTYAHFAADYASAMENFDAAEMDTGDVVVVTRSRLARKMGLMLNALGQKQFSGLNAKGGEMEGLQVITSTNVDYTEDSPQEGDNLIFIKPSEIFLADDGQITIDVSREATIQMNDAPDDPATASTVMVSLWQHNMVGFRAERFITWLKRRDAAVQYIKAAKYA